MDIAVDTENPYPGLRPFRAEETHLFFGRDEQRTELLHRLRRSRFLAIVGTSGSGKSSLVRAGLLPGLHGGFMAGAADVWRVVDLRPGTDAIGNLARALDAPGALRDARPDDEPSFTLATLRRSGLGLAETVREARLPAGEKVLVLVDQFEELFRAIEATDSPQSADDAAAFVKLLLEAARQDELPIYVVLTMRSDFLGECARFRDLPEAINDGQYLIPRLTRDQRLEAITGPAAVFGVTLSSTLVNRVLNDVGDNPDQLPILQHALMRTWDHWQQRRAQAVATSEIELRDYEEVGGMAQALSLHADEVFDGLGTARRRAIAERLFKSLSAIGAGGLPVRRLAKVREIAENSGATPDEVVSVVEAFRAPGNSFLMPPLPEPLTPERYIDISHESLMRNWKRMKDWVAEEAESARIYERLSSTALLHEKDEAGLWGYPDLGVALKWRGEHKPNAVWAQRYNAVFDKSMAFLDASQRHAQAAENAKGTRRRVWILSLLLAAFAIIFGSLSLWRDDLARGKKLAEQARQARVEFDGLQAIADASAAREAAGAPSAAELSACKRETVSAPRSEHVKNVLAKLCNDPGKLDDDDRRLIDIYKRIVDGRWGEAGKGIMSLREPALIEGARRLLDQVSDMRSPSDRAERQHLLRLYDKETGADRAGTPPEHPVHKRLEAALKNGRPPLTAEEELLLRAYAVAAGKPRLTDGKRNGDGERDTPESVTEGLRLLPQGHAYEELAQVAFNPDSRLLAGYEAAMNVIRPFMWVIVIFMAWPLWRVWRFIRRRSRVTFEAKPNALRRTMAAFFDVAIALLVGWISETTVTLSAEIAGYLLKADVSSWTEVIGGVVGLSVSAAYLLFRDAIKLRLRRSPGKALFDLMPVEEHGAVLTATGMRASMRRNALVAGVWVAAVGLGMASDSIALPVGPLMAAIGFFLLLLLIDGARGWFGERRTFGDRWSRTRVIDAQSPEALAVQP